MPKLLVIWPIIGAKHSLGPQKLPEVGADVCQRLQWRRSQRK